MLLLSAASAFTPTAGAAPKGPPIDVSTSSPAALGREAVAVLAGASSDGDSEIRALADASWGDLGNPAAVPILKRALSDNNADVRIAAAVSLVKLGDVQGLVALIDETKPITSGQAKSPADELRQMARDAARARATLKLGETGRDAAIAALKSALADPAGEVRDAAAVELARLGQGDSKQFLDAMKDTDEGVRASAAHSLGLIGRDGLDGLKKALSNDPAVAVRAEAATALGAFGDPASLALLSGALTDKSGRVRLAAARALARRSEPGSTAVLKKLADQAPSPELALVAAAALAARGEDADVALAELTLSQKDPDLKALAVAALAASTRVEARDLLASTMRSDADPRIRALAAAAMIGQLRRAGGTK